MTVRTGTATANDVPGRRVARDVNVTNEPDRVVGFPGSSAGFSAVRVELPPPTSYLPSTGTSGSLPHCVGSTTIRVAPLADS
jgi:hypothetical protein